MNENNFPEENELLEEIAGEYAEEAYAGEVYSEEAYPEEECVEEAYPEEEYTEEPIEEEYAEEGYEEDIHDRLTDPETAEELDADDHAMYSAGLVHPEDAEYIYEDAQPFEEEIPEVPAEPYQDNEYRDPEYQEELPEEPEEEPEEEDDSSRRRERPAHKGRPKRKKGYGFLGIPHIIATLIWLAIIVAIGVSLGRMIWVCAADVLAFGREEQLVTITITSDDTIEDIADKLGKVGLIRYPELFKIYADLAVDEGEITTGTFTLNTLYDYHALVNGMSPSSATRKVVEGVLIPEGFTCKQIFARLEEYGVCKAADLEAYAADGALDEYWFLENVERGDKYCLEGYLFPATYDFYENSTPKQALEKMLDAFKANYSEELQAQLATLNERLSEMMRSNGCSEEYIAANQLTIRDTIIVASLIEKEMATEEEGRAIASVIYNRLTQDTEVERRLQIDATFYYALGGYQEDLTAEDLQMDSPYNTYINSGLVPGPIANPGLACLKAAMEPEDTDYYYYVLDPENGEHDFSKTFEEHDKKVKKYYGEE